MTPVGGDRGRGRIRTDAVVVVDTGESDGAGGPVVDWGIPVEIPHHVLADLLGERDPHVVVVRNGIVLHAPGRLDLGRSTRLANRAHHARIHDHAWVVTLGDHRELTVTLPTGQVMRTGPPSRSAP